MTRISSTLACNDNRGRELVDFWLCRRSAEFREIGRSIDARNETKIHSNRGFIANRDVHQR